MRDVPGPHDEAVAQIFDASYRRLVGQLHAVCGDLAEAEEVVQEAFVRAVAQGGRFAQVDNPEAWLRTVALNHARSRHRRRRLGDALHLVRSVGQRTDTDPALASDAHVVLVEALRRLPAAQREVIGLHHLADLPVAEVAATLGVPVGTVKAQLSRGRAALAAVLAEPVHVPTATTGGGA